jgi:hypothetical protein
MDFNFSVTILKNFFLTARVFILISVLIISTLATEASEEPLSAEEEKILQEQARLRTYPGGLEESDLNIQGKLYVPVIDKPTEEATETSEF